MLGPLIGIYSLGQSLAPAQVKPLKFLSLESFRKEKHSLSINLSSSKLICIHTTVEFNLACRGILNNHMVFFVNIQRFLKNVLSIYI